MLTKEQLNQFAEKSGFGAVQRNKYQVRLQLFAKMVEADAEERMRQEQAACYVRNQQ